MGLKIKRILEEKLEMEILVAGKASEVISFYLANDPFTLNSLMIH